MRRRESDPSMIPGEYFLASEPVMANAGRRTLEIEVANVGDRPIQVGSHFHFFEVNRSLRFERARAFGMRLNIPAGTAVRFEPGDSKTVTLVELGGASKVYGLNGLTNGPANQSVEQNARRQAACEVAKSQGFEGS
jgi:urease beta subunit